MLEVSTHKDFDFYKYLAEDAGYALKEEFSKCKIFDNGKIEIMVYQSDEDEGYEMVKIDLNSYNIVTMKFIPKSKVMCDIMLGQIANEVETIDVSKKLAKEKAQQGGTNRSNISNC